MKRLTAWIGWLLTLALIVGCTNAGSYVSETYPLIDVQGAGKDTSRIYLVENKEVPAVAKELAVAEQPEEISKENADQMFLAYPDKIIHVQKDPENAVNSLVEISTVEYARNHYDSSFLQGYLTASILQSMFGGGWYSGGGGYYGKGYQDYRGYSSVPSQNGTYRSPYDTAPDTAAPKTSDRSGSFGTKKDSAGSGSPGTGSGSTGSTAPPPGGSSGSFTTKPKSGSKSGSASARKSDGSTPTYKSPSKPKTSSRSGSFSKKRR